MMFCWSDYKTIKDYEKGGTCNTEGKHTNIPAQHLIWRDGKLGCTWSENTVVLKVYVNKKLQNPPFCAHLRKKIVQFAV